MAARLPRIGNARLGRRASLVKVTKATDDGIVDAIVRRHSSPQMQREHLPFAALASHLFDIEVALILPWGTIVREVGTTGLIAVGTFVGVLMLGWAWAIRKGALEWV